MEGELLNEPFTSLFPGMDKMRARGGKKKLGRVRFGIIKFIISPLLLGCGEKVLRKGCLTIANSQFETNKCK